MHRARQRSLSLALVATAVVLFALLPCRAAWAFHTGNLFDKPPGSGGGGGKFYTGAPRERGWTCTACHLDAPRRTRVSLSSDPPELATAGRYTPDASYTLTFTLDNEYLGLGSPLSNYNALVISAVDGAGQTGGSFLGYAAEDFYAQGTSTLASAGRTPNETAWSFDWHAPAAGSGDIRLFVAVVDGNGANSLPTATLTDPFGDDVAIGEIRLVEPSNGTHAALERRTVPRASRASGSWTFGWAAFIGIAAIAGLLPNKKRRTRCDSR